MIKEKFNREKYIKEYRIKNKIKIKEQRKKYRLLNKEKRNRYLVERRKVDIIFKLSYYQRNRLNKVLKRNQKSGSAVKDLGCSVDYLKKYLENQFTEGMTWDNWSKDGWHIDHQIPLSIVDLTDRENLKHVCHYTNLQPMWWNKNIGKGNKIIR